MTKILQILENDKLLKLLNEKEIEIINKIKTDLRKKDKAINSDTFRLKKNTIAEINSVPHETEIINYLIHRYKYEIFPITKEILDFPPLIQIEPSSICNFRCVFCFETDKTFTNKKNGDKGI